MSQTTTDHGADVGAEAFDDGWTSGWSQDSWTSSDWDEDERFDESGRLLLPAEIGDYRAEELLGEGGMGAIYRGVDPNGRPVALKHISQRKRPSYLARQRFRREAKIVSLLEHRTIVRVHECFETELGDWIAMELVDGRTVTEMLEDEGPFSPEHVARIGADIAAGLAVAHEAGIVHRDLKADNIMITEGGATRILDFGVAKWNSKGDEESLTLDGQILGTIEAMSPEQALGLPVDHRSDLFSLGSLLFKLLTAQSPFRATSQFQTLRNICLAIRPPVTDYVLDVDPDLARLVDQLLEKSPDDRPQTAGEVRERLERIAG